MFGVVDLCVFFALHGIVVSPTCGGDMTWTTCKDFSIALGWWLLVWHSHLCVTFLVYRCIQGLWRNLRTCHCESYICVNIIQKHKELLRLAVSLAIQQICRLYISTRMKLLHNGGIGVALYLHARIILSLWLLYIILHQWGEWMNGRGTRSAWTSCVNKPVDFWLSSGALYYFSLGSWTGPVRGAPLYLTSLCCF